MRYLIFVLLLLPACSGLQEQPSQTTAPSVDANENVPKSMPDVTPELNLCTPTDILMKNNFMELFYEAMQTESPFEAAMYVYIVAETYLAEVIRSETITVADYLGVQQLLLTIVATYPNEQGFPILARLNAIALYCFVECPEEALALAEHATLTEDEVLRQIRQDVLIGCGDAIDAYDLMDEEIIAYTP